MTELDKTSKTELVKYKGNDVSQTRNYYYTKLSFKVKGMPFSIPFKVDTGAAYTIIGFEMLKSKNLEEYIKSANIKETATDASGTDLDLYGFIVEQFKLTEDIVIPKLMVYFSDKVGAKALLGFDILSLFDVVYLKNNKEFWLHNYKGVIEACMAEMLKNKKDYLNPELILSVHTKGERIHTVDMVDAQ